MRRLLLWLGVLTIGSAPVSATPYWIAYEANDFPENEGWERQISNGGAVRSIENGLLYLDTTADLWSNDFYRLSRNIDPFAGETFRAEWNLRVDAIVGERDVEPSVGVFSDDAWAIGLEFGRDHLVSVFESYEAVFYEPDMPHDFVMTSNDMREYILYLDGTMARKGSFVEVLTPGFVTWGSGMLGVSSRNHWDFFRFGVVPEPGTAATLAGLSAACVLRKRSV